MSQETNVVKKVLITGISGVVGSSAYMLMHQFPDQYELYGLGRRRALSERVTDGRNIALPDSRHFVVEIADFDAVRAAVDGMDVVVHLAAYLSDNDWQVVLRDNIDGAYNIFEACRQAGVSRVITASTVQVSTGQRKREPYNAVSTGRLQPLPDGVPPLSPRVAAEPRNLYAASKVFNESLCHVFAHKYEMSCLAIRIGWVVGEDEVPNPNSEDIWCSQRDIAQLIRSCVAAPDHVTCDVFYGMSNNRYLWVDLSNARDKLGFEPQDRAEDHLPE